MSKSTESTGQKQAKPRGKPFKPGQSGNPAGRPRGSRNRLSDAFLSSLADDFEAKGSDVLVAVRESDPAAYLRVAASVLPKQSQIEMASDLSMLTDDQLKAQITALSAKVGETL